MELAATEGIWGNTEHDGLAGPRNWKVNWDPELESLCLKVHDAWNSINTEVVQRLEIPNIEENEDGQSHLMLAVL